jgi:hypothetical protein
VKYADQPLLTGDIQKVDALYLWFVRLKKESIAQRGSGIISSRVSSAQGSPRSANPLLLFPSLGAPRQVRLIDSEQVIQHVERVHERPDVSCFVHFV